ncbi:MAG: TIGR03960 family B12-binding radical SAM protein [Clostridia bacterium]|nr:TIGR03960 family B12-binding radical SAM protein [Clostridia bacterium]
MLRNKIDDILYLVEKPSRYIGDEINSVKKTVTTEMIRYGFCFPDVYEVGMSHLGSHILYGVLNNIEDVYCERVYAPWSDCEAILRRENLPLFTHETRTDIKEMDILNFTLQYELSYTNILNMLNMSNIPLRSKDRSEEDPFIMAGGPCAYNPEPLAEIVDFFSLGEGEEVFIDLMNLYREKKKNNWTKDEFLRKVALVDGIYVPKFYEVTYNEDMTLKSFEPISDEFPKKIQKRIVEDMNGAYYPTNFVLPYTDTVHDRAMIEIFRGCTRGCRFCQAGMIYRPVREKSKEVILKSARDILENTGYEEISLTSLSTLDHSDIKDTIYQMIDEHQSQMVGISLPSLRTDDLAVDVLQEIQKIRKTGLTFAPEAGTQRMRDVINKGVTEQDLDETLMKIFGLGWSRVKLYFMIGLPTETYEDLDGINDLGNRSTWLFKQIPAEQRQGTVSVTLSASNFVPKPFTPFQWMAQDTLETFKEKQKYLRSKIVNKKVKFNYHDAETSVLEGVFARGDRRLSEVLIKAYELGCVFDGWQEFFNFEKWMQAFEACGIDYKFYNRERSYEELLPWDFIDVGVRKAFLIRENENAINGVVTADCRQQCVGCGINIDLIGRDC